MDLLTLDLSCKPSTLSTICQEYKFIGFYFAAHWAPPARNFLPKLISAYKSLNSGSKQLQIIFVSFDRDEESFEAYSEEMPWPSVPYKNIEHRVKLAHYFQLENTFNLVVINSNLKLISKNGVNELREKGMSSVELWEVISDNVKNFSVSPSCEKGHLMSYVNVFEKIRCCFCKNEIIKGWTCQECSVSVCQTCQESFSNSILAEKEELMCFRSHRLRRSTNLNAYYQKKFLNSQYSCRTCNLFPDGTGLHCYSCLFDICYLCEQILSSKPSVKCPQSHSMIWAHDLCAQIEEKYKRCEFRCEKCHESFLGGGAFSCSSCEFYICLRCTKVN
jgi:hypothetical protein